MKNNDSIIMEIRAGVGGNEAALFAKDLFSMYSKYAQSKNWSLKVLDENITDLSGIKSISFILKGEGVIIKCAMKEECIEFNAYQKLKKEEEYILQQFL